MQQRVFALTKQLAAGYTAYSLELFVSAFPSQYEERVADSLSAIRKGLESPVFRHGGAGGYSQIFIVTKTNLRDGGIEERKRFDQRGHCFNCFLVLVAHRKNTLVHPELVVFMAIHENLLVPLDLKEEVDPG